MHRTILLLFLLFMTSTIVFADNPTTTDNRPLEQHPGVQVYGGSESDLRNYIRRTAGAGGFYSNTSTSIYIRQLPPSMPTAMNFPDSFSVVGSTVREEGTYIEIIMETRQGTTTAKRLLESLLQNDGWSADRRNHMAGGFNPQPLSLIFCYNDTVSLNANIFGYKDDDYTEVRLYITTGRNSLCSRLDDRGMMFDDPFFNIPYLPPPDNVTVENNGGGSGGGPFGPGNAFQSAILNTDKELESLREYYFEQLKSNNNWKLLERGNYDELSYSTWSFQNENGELLYGSLLITDVPGKDNKYLAMIQVFTDSR